MERPAAAGHADSGYSAIGLLSTRTSSAHPLRTRTSSSATSTSRPSTTPVPSARRRPRSRSMSMPQSRVPCSSWVIASPPPWIQVRSDGCLERPARLAGPTEPPVAEQRRRKPGFDLLRGNARQSRKRTISAQPRRQAVSDVDRPVRIISALSGLQSDPEALHAGCRGVEHHPRGRPLGQPGQNVVNACECVG